MRQYLDALKYVRDNGVQKGDRTGTGTTEVFGIQTRYNFGGRISSYDHQKLYSKASLMSFYGFLRVRAILNIWHKTAFIFWDESAVQEYLEKTGQEIPELTAMNGVLE